MNSDYQSVWIGYDPKEAAAFAVAKYSITQYNRMMPVKGVVLDDLRMRGMYYRPTQERINSDGRRHLWDTISDAPMATEFSIARFLVPHLAQRGLALFVDSDVMVMRNISRLFELARNDKAVMCVKHEHRPDNDVKMDGQIQTRYGRKNWSSVCIFNVSHPSNKKLTIELINTVPGRDLHRFCWLDDDEIGDLPPEWNYLVGNSKIESEPALVHFTNGLPDVPGYEQQEYADRWRAMVPYAVGAL